MHSNDTPEHGSFHLDDDIYLDYQQLGPDELAPAWRHDTSHICEELIHLREISLQSGHILANIRKQHHDIGNYLSLLDKKIEILSQLAGTIALGGEINPTHRVTMSADELHFDAEEAMAQDTPLRLKVVLFPSHLCLHLQSTVSSCERLDEGYRIGVKFEGLGETEHEALIRHLLEKQSAQLRRERGE